jgi:hypothetical protein
LCRGIDSRVSDGNDASFDLEFSPQESMKFLWRTGGLQPLGKPGIEPRNA